MAVSRLRPSHRTHRVIRSLSTFSRQYCLARPRSYNACDVGARNRGTKRLVLRGRGFHSSSTNKEPQEQVDYYKIMKVSRNATAEQIKNSYFQLSKKLHPDTGKADREAYELMRKAYTILSTDRRKHDEDLRKYDAKVASSAKSEQSPTAEEPYDPINWWKEYQKHQKQAAAGVKKKAAPQQPETPPEPQPPPEVSWRTKRRRERQAAGEAGAGAHGAHQRPLEMGFRPRSSWDPRFAKFFDDWSKKMKEQGWDPSQTTVGPIPGSPAAAGNKAAQMMDSNLLSEWIKHARAQGKDPMGSLFTTSAGRGSATGLWLKNRMAALDREEAKKVGGAWERGGVRRGDSLPRSFNSSWGKGPAGSKRPVYSSDGPSGADSTAQTSGRKGTRGMSYAWNSAEGMEHAREWDAARNLGGSGTGEETFNAPWDSVPGRGFKNDVPRPWWAAGAPPQGKDPHAYDTWTPDPKFADAWGHRPYRHPSMLESTLFASPSDSGKNSTPPTGTETQVYSGPVKRDYSKGHQLDERYEEDRVQMAANERRMLSMVGFAVALAAVVAAGRAAGV